jgi:hypothetical protein
MGRSIPSPKRTLLLVVSHGSLSHSAGLGKVPAVQRESEPRAAVVQNMAKVGVISVGSNIGHRAEGFHQDQRIIDEMEDAASGSVHVGEGLR